MSAAVVLQATFDDPADWIDLAFACLWSELRVCSVVAPREAIADLREFTGDRGERLVWCDTDDPRLALAALDQPASWIVSGAHAAWRDMVLAERGAYRASVARTFVVGGHANRPGKETVPVDPRLRDAHPERFARAGDPRIADPVALESCLGSGEGVVWLPRDICLWRFDAIGMLADVAGGAAARVLDMLGERFPASDRVLMATTPALLLAALPDTMAWLRWFRLETARYSAGTGLAFGVPDPNLHVATGVDGHMLNRRVVAVFAAASFGPPSPADPETPGDACP